MPIIIKIGSTAMRFFWAIVALIGFLLINYGFFRTLSGLFEFGEITLANNAALSNISGGVVVFVLGLVVVAAGYLGIRGRIIITIDEDNTTNPS